MEKGRRFVHKVFVTTTLTHGIPGSLLMTECNTSPLEFQPLGGRDVVAEFTGETITSDRQVRRGVRRGAAASRSRSAAGRERRLGRLLRGRLRSRFDRAAPNRTAGTSGVPFVRSSGFLAISALRLSAISPARLASLFTPKPRGPPDGRCPSPKISKRTDWHKSIHSRRCNQSRPRRMLPYTSPCQPWPPS